VVGAALGYNVDIATGDKLTDARYAVPEEVLATLMRLIREVRFGSIEVVVHEGRITQIERREKVRFGPSGSARRE
jgi:hypothetical protein